MTSLRLTLPGIMRGPRLHSTAWRDLVRSSHARFKEKGLRPRVRETSLSDSGSRGDETGLARPIVWAKRAVLLIDVVESVRLIEQDETGAVSRWLAFVEHVRNRILPERHGRIVKSLGDGLLLDFEDVRAAVSAAFAIQQASNRGNASLPPERQMHLRMGLEVSDVVVEADDVHGRGVNLAARLMTLANPGEIIISAHARDQLTADLDADIEDLGDCFVRHLSEPVRAYRVGPPGPRPAIKRVMLQEELAPSIAVVPFRARQVPQEHEILGEVLAEEIIRELSRSSDLHVISRLSTTALRSRQATLGEIGTLLNADFVLSGIYNTDGQGVILDAELAEAKSGRVVWTDRLRDRVSGILSGEPEMTGRVVTEVSAAIIRRELERAQSQPLPTLKAYTLLLGAITLMHRLSLQDFERARALLQALLERGVRHPIPLAWMANWHVLRVQQGWSDDVRQESYLALEATKRALDSDPRCSLALAIDGFVHTNLLKKLDVAEERYNLALAENPNNALAWLLRGTLYAFEDDGARAVDNSQRALQLTPLDPNRWFYESLAATACVVAHQYERALELSNSSFRANRKHTSTLRAKIAAEWHLGLHDQARGTAKQLLELEPALTVSGWLQRSPAASYNIGRDFADVLRKVGVPN
jgi:class 3 adenylate cyclase/TolB-like protein